MVLQQSMVASIFWMIAKLLGYYGVARLFRLVAKVFSVVAIALLIWWYHVLRGC